MARGIEEALQARDGEEAVAITINAERPRKGVFEVNPNPNTPTLTPTLTLTLTL